MNTEILFILSRRRSDRNFEMPSSKFKSTTLIFFVICNALDCLPFAIPLATCEPTCENGGSCLSGNRCSCLPAYRGRRCQYSKFYFILFLFYLYNVGTGTDFMSLFAATRDCSPEAQGFTGVFNCTNYEKENRYCMLLCITRESTDQKTRKSRSVFVHSIRAPTTRGERSHQSSNHKTGKGCLIGSIRAPTTRQENIALVGSISAPITRQEKVCIIRSIKASIARQEKLALY